MRDIIKSQEYFDECITYEKNNINEFSQVLASLEPENVRGRYNGLMIIANFNKNLFKLLYSVGDSIEDIYIYYKEWIKLYSEICTKDDSMYDIIDMFSIAVFYEKRKEDFAEYLIAIVKKLNLDDGMINACLRYLGFDFKDNKNSILSYLNELLNGENKVENLMRVIKKWYSFHKDASWYDTHKSKNNTYRGYWCVELGAIAKIFKLNDEKLKNQQYYPYDLVHFIDEGTKDIYSNKISMNKRIG